MNKSIKQSLFKNMRNAFTSKANKIQSKYTILELILSSSEDDYCCLINNDKAIASNGFKEFLSLENINNYEDIKDALNYEDNEKFKIFINQINDTNKSFPIKLKNNDNKRTYRMTGIKYPIHDATIIWLKDITKEENKPRKNKINKINLDQNELLATLEAMIEPMWVRDSSLRIKWVNRTYSDILATDSEEIIKSQKELPLSGIKKKDYNSINEMSKIAWDSQKEQSNKKHIIVNGQRKLFLIKIIPVKNMNITIGFAKDITKEEELEREIKRHNATNKGMLEQLRTAFGIYDVDTKLEFYNSAFSQLWDLDDTWLNTKPKLGSIMEKLRETRKLPEQADFKGFKRSWNNMFTDLIEPHEEMLYLPDGTALRMLVIPHSMGGLIMTFEDVTSRLELESSYNTLVAVQQETLDNLAEGVTVIGADGRLKLWNPSFANLWSLNPEDLSSEPHISKIAEKISSRYKEMFRHSINEKIMLLALNRDDREGRIQRENGSLIDYATVALPDGRMLVTYIDVTDKIRVENALKEKNAALEAAEQLKLDFLTNVSYQLRTPLNSIMGFSEILSNEYFGELNKKQKEYSIDIQKSGKRLLSLIDDILDLSTIEAGYLELNKANMNVFTLLNNIYEITIDWARKKKIEISLQCPENIGHIYADKRRIKQIIFHLISNAINHTPEDGKIVLKSQIKNDKLLISIKNSGEPIPKNLQAKIFEPFEKLSMHKNSLNNNGVGLGLTLVKSITKMHKGKVTLISTKEEGTIFTLSFPILHLNKSNNSK